MHQLLERPTAFGDAGPPDFLTMLMGRIELEVRTVVIERPPGPSAETLTFTERKQVARFRRRKRRRLAAIYFPRKR